MREREDRRHEERPKKEGREREAGDKGDQRLRPHAAYGPIRKIEEEREHRETREEETGGRLP